ncbi:MAG: thioredoxin family protein [Burkholderiaceae bacterium]|nr:thioredoxin family protein [Burkholderiaceae bacterium]
MTLTLTRSIIVAVFIASGTLAHALEIKPYSAQALAQAQKANQPVALHFHADWCPTCRAQEKVLQTLKAEPGLDLTVLVANYDTEKALKRQFKVNAQSTLIVLRGQKEAARLVGDTSDTGIRAALKSAI